MSANKSKFLSRFGSGLAGLLILLVIIGAVNLIISNLRLRVDLTAEQLYTLSNGSKQVLGKLENDVTLKFYFSASADEMPMYLKTYANQVQDLLKEYELAGKGHIVLEAYEPKPDSMLKSGRSATASSRSRPTRSANRSTSAWSRFAARPRRSFPASIRVLRRLWSTTSPA